MVNECFVKEVFWCLLRVQMWKNLLYGVMSKEANNTNFTRFGRVERKICTQNWFDIFALVDLNWRLIWLHEKYIGIPSCIFHIQIAHPTKN